MNITGKTAIEEALQAHPEAAQVFDKYQMSCYSCMGAAAESLASGALMHGVNLDELLFDLNQLGNN